MRGMAHALGRRMHARSFAGSTLIALWTGCAPAKVAPPLEPARAERAAAPPEPAPPLGERTDPTEEAEREAAAVVRQLHPQLLACYAKRLKRDPKAEAYLLVDVLVGEDGRPRDVATTGGARLGEALDCITSRLRSAAFERPAKTGTTRIRVPLAFEP